MFLTTCPCFPSARQQDKGKGENIVLLKTDTFTCLYLSEETEKIGRHNVEQGKKICTGSLNTYFTFIFLFFGLLVCYLLIFIAASFSDLPVHSLSTFSLCSTDLCNKYFPWSSYLVSSSPLELSFLLKKKNI